MQGMNATELRELAHGYDSAQTLGAYSFIHERADAWKHSYFVIPYPKLLKNMNATRKSLILSLARQESRFVPAAISTSYALGMMQFMPFLAVKTAKELEMKRFDIDDMFRPEIAYAFADHHLDYLEKYLQHPVFVAYAYNGGIGFTRRLLRSGEFFAHGAYEPYLSLETVWYDESREYAKKVLANYIIYARHFGVHVSIKDLLEELVEPAKTDKFRQQD
jgi:soluble lytic murein transglycosylase